MLKLALTLTILSSVAYATEPDPTLTPQNEDHYNIVQNKLTNGSAFNSPEAIRRNGQLKIYFQNNSGINRVDCTSNSCSNPQLVLSRGSLAYLGEPSITNNGQQYFMLLSGVSSGQDPNQDANRKLYISTSNINSGTIWSTPQLISSSHHQAAATVKNGQIHVYAVKNTDEQKIDRLILNNSGSSVTSATTINITNSTLYGYYAQPHVRYNAATQDFQMLVDRVSSSGVSTIDYLSSSDGLSWEVLYGKAIEGQDGAFASQSTTDPSNFEQAFFSGEDANGNVNIYSQDLSLPSTDDEIDPSSEVAPPSPTTPSTNEGTETPDPTTVTPPSSEEVPEDVPEADSTTDPNPLGSCPSKNSALRCKADQTIDFSPRVDSNGCFLPPRCVDLDGGNSTASTSTNSQSQNRGGPSLFLNFKINPFKSVETQFKEFLQKEDFSAAQEFGLPQTQSDTKNTTSSDNNQNSSEVKIQPFKSKSRTSRTTNRRTSRSLFSRIQALKNKKTSTTNSLQENTEDSENETVKTSTDNRLQAMKSTRQTNRYKFYSRRTVTANSRSKTSVSRRSKSQVYEGYQVYEK